ncbi:hypothetical protein [uncultured Tenacibaculum sp.]|uniref:hypothetical protein n=1 Tax=uncultured Tenacibaculum sp. TaxID=174713 RepID=UPI00261D4BBE|nr:hypothetical protein [uncultured Tenacibaculum sp.]
MKTLICSYSSDSRTLYKADIYKVLSMPKGFIIHFRYKLKYVEELISNDIKTFLNQDVIIFYTITKNVEKETNIPIRKAKLVRVDISEDTGLFHAYMELEDFVNVELKEEKPTDKFFVNSDLKIINQDNKWFDKIEKVKNSFGDMLFYYIKDITTYKGKTIKATQRNDRKSSTFKLKHGEKYFIELAIGNPKETDSKLKFESSSDDITANIPNPMEITAQYDDKSIPIYIKTLDVSNASSFISFNPTNSDDNVNTEYNLNIEIVKELGWKKPFFFGLLTLLTLIGFVLVKEGYDSLNRIFEWENSIDTGLILGCALMTICPAILFFHYNKK